MPAVTMLDRLIEAAFKELISPVVTAPTYHLSHDQTENVPPSIVIRASIGSEEPVRGSGVFSVPVEIMFTERYDDVTPSVHSAQCSQILQCFYDSTNLSTKLNATTAIGLARTYSAKLDSSEASANNEERSYTQNYKLTVIAYPNSIAS
jgi:hypothetical protein